MVDLLSRLGDLERRSCLYGLLVGRIRRNWTVARAVVKDGVERFPAAYLDERAMEIRLLSDHRDQLVAELTRIQNRLRWHLLQLCPQLEAQLPRAGLTRQAVQERIARRPGPPAPSQSAR